MTCKPVPLRTIDWTKALWIRSATHFSNLARPSMPWLCSKQTPRIILSQPMPMRASERHTCAQGRSSLQYKATGNLSLWLQTMQTEKKRYGRLTSRELLSLVDGGGRVRVDDAAHGIPARAT